jgi:cobalamin biosynthesis protein CobD/CbiB
MTKKGGDHASNDKPSKITRTRIIAAGTLLALIISAPAIVVTIVMHHVLKTSLIMTMIASMITLFIAMGFGYKLSTKLAKVQLNIGNKNDNDN